MRIFVIACLLAISYAQTETRVGIDADTGIYTYVLDGYEVGVGYTNKDAETEVGFIGWLQQGWGHIVTGVDNMLEKTGLDNVVHWFTGGKRLFNPDGSFNNELLKGALEHVLYSIGNILDRSALGRLLGAVHGNPFNRDGSLKGGFDVNGAATQMNPLMRDFADIVKGKSEEIWNDIKDGWTAVTQIVNNPWFTQDDKEFFMDVLFGRRDLNNQADLNRFQDLVGDNLQKICEGVRYRLGLVDIDPPTLMFGTGVNAGAAFILSGDVALQGFVSFPLANTESLEFSVAGTVSLGIGFDFGGDVGMPITFSFNTRASGVGGFGLTVTFAVTGGAGAVIDIGWALNTNANQLQLSTITISPAAGARAGLAVMGSYTNVLWDHVIQLSPVDLADIGVDQEAARHFEQDWFKCSDSDQYCYCNGDVRYGKGDDWYLITDYNQDKIYCHPYYFGGTYISGGECQCLTSACSRPHSRHYEIDCGFWWWDTCGDGCRAYGGCRGACCKVQQDYCEGDNDCLSDRSCRGIEAQEYSEARVHAELEAKVGKRSFAEAVIEPIRVRKENAVASQPVQPVSLQQNSVMDVPTESGWKYTNLILALIGCMSISYGVYTHCANLSKYSAIEESEI